MELLINLSCPKCGSPSISQSSPPGVIPSWECPDVACDWEFELEEWDSQTTLRAQLTAAERQVEALRGAVESIREQCEQGFIPCSNCGHEEPLDDCDLAFTASQALEATPPAQPDPRREALEEMARIAQPQFLRSFADVLDRLERDPNANKEVQNDLRRWADCLAALGEQGGAADGGHTG